jgi:competence protein ComFC
LWITLNTNMFEFLSKILYPYHCVSCDIELKNDYICLDCLNSVKTIEEQTCPVCEKRSLCGATHQECATTTPLNGLFVATSYKDKIMHKLIHTHKYKFVKKFHEQLALIAIKALKNNNIISDLKTQKPIITPVPLHPLRHRWRGFNQSEIIAKNLSEYFDIPYEELLIRVKNNTPQKDITNTLRRQQNIKNAFKLKKASSLEKYKKSTIIIVDDIATTLSTINECAKKIKLLKPRKIYAITLARNI